MNIICYFMTFIEIIPKLCFSKVKNSNSNIVTKNTNFR